MEKKMAEIVISNAFFFVIIHFKEGNFYDTEH